MVEDGTAHIYRDDQEKDTTAVIGDMDIGVSEFISNEEETKFSEMIEVHDNLI